MNDLRKKSLEATPTIYLTLISIIQSLPLLLFAEQLDFKFESPFEFFERMLMYIAILQMIVITWHEYALSTICFTWAVGFSDTWIPMLLGVCQYWVVGNAEIKKIGLFLLSLTIFVLLALLAFINRDRKMRRILSNEAARLKAGDALAKTKYWLGAALLEFAIGTLLIWHHPIGWPAVAVLGLVNASFIFQAVRCEATYKPLLASERGESSGGGEASGASSAR